MIDAEVVPVDNDVVLPTRFSAIKPVTTIDEARALWSQYRDLENSILDGDDYTYALSYTANNKTETIFQTDAELAQKQYDALKANPKYANVKLVKRKKKSGFRKIARAFGISLPTQENETVTFPVSTDKHTIKVSSGVGYTITEYMDGNFTTMKVTVHVTVVAPNGATMVGTGACSASERQFTHKDHDILSTAWTRAISRAISDMVGWGEVSAEEISDGGAFDDTDVTRVAGPTNGAMTMPQFIKKLNDNGSLNDAMTKYGNIAQIDSSMYEGIVAEFSK